MRGTIFCGIALTLLAGCGKGENASVPMPTVGLLEAAKTGNIAQVKAHIAHSSKLDIADGDGLTALDYSAMNEDLDMYQLLKDTGAYESDTQLISFLVKHGMLKEHDVAAEAFQIVDVAADGETVRLRAEPKWTTAMDDEQARTRLVQLARNAARIKPYDRVAILHRVGALWSLDISDTLASDVDARSTRYRRRPADPPPYISSQAFATLSQGNYVARAVIAKSAVDSPAIRWYVKEYKDNPFMLKLLVVAGEIVVKVAEARDSEQTRLKSSS